MEAQSILTKLHGQQYKDAAENGPTSTEKLSDTQQIGRTGAVNTGVNKAFGTLTAIVDP